MTLDEMKAEFDRLAELPSDDPEYPEWAKVTARRSPTRDLHAMLLLDFIAPADEAGDTLISAAEHDVIYFQTDPEDFAAHATLAQVWELVACGVRFDSEFDCFAKFV